jgi:hypothetical protein
MTRGTLAIGADLAAPAVAPRHDTPTLPGIESLTDQLDQATLAYVLATQEPFDLLRSAAGQIAGILLLSVAAGKAAAGHPTFALVDQVHREAGERLRGAIVPTRCLHHHHHLMRAFEAIGQALSAGRRHLHRGGGESVDAVLAPVKVANRHLDSTARALPGFAMVDLSGCCCAEHAASGSQMFGSAIA